MRSLQRIYFHLVNESDRLTRLVNEPAHAVALR